MNRLSDYRRELDALRFSPDQKARIAARAADAAQAQPQRTRRLPLRRTAVLAAALAVVLAVSAGASGALKSAAEAFAGLFGGTPAQTEVVDRVGRPIGASDTYQGITITADAVLGDRYNAAILFTIRRDDGSPLLPQPVEARDLLLGGFGGVDLDILGGSHGSSWFVDEDPADDHLQMVQVISSDTPLSHCTARAAFTALCRWDEAEEKPVPLLEGHWSFRFELNYEDTSVSLGSGETFTQDGMTFTVDHISLSPVAVKVDYTVDREVVWSNAASGRQPTEDRLQMGRFLEHVEILLTKKDGTVVDLSGAGGSISPEEGRTVCSKSQVFEEILPLEEIAAISVGGITYPLIAEN